VASSELSKNDQRSETWSSDAVMKRGIRKQKNNIEDSWLKKHNVCMQIALGDKTSVLETTL